MKNILISLLVLAFIASAVYMSKKQKCSSRNQCASTEDTSNVLVTEEYYELMDGDSVVSIDTVRTSF